MTVDINWHILKGTDGQRYILPTNLEGIHCAMDFMKKVVYEKELFFKTHTTASGQSSKTISSLGNHWKHLQRYGELFSRDYKFSPLIAFFFEQYHKHPIRGYQPPVHGHDQLGVGQFDDFVATMRKNALKTKLKKHVADWDSKPEKNAQRLVKLETVLFKCYNRVTAISLDFHYHNATFTPSEIEKIALEADTRKACLLAEYLAGKDISEHVVVEGRIALEEVQKDRERLFRNMKGKTSLFEHLVAYVWRISYAKSAGYYLHVLLFFDGDYVQDHECLAQEIGHYWANVITQGRGYFRNCKMETRRYRDIWKFHEIDHWDKVKREKLLANILNDFCKSNHLVRVVPYAGCHLFGCGFVHRQRLSRVDDSDALCAVGSDRQLI